ncbi:MAG: RING finger protein [Nitrospira sp.]
MNERTQPNFSLQRCPYCHDSIRSGEDNTPCHVCFAWHHEECWKEHGGCSPCSTGKVNISTQPKGDETTTFLEGNERLQAELQSFVKEFHEYQTRSRVDAENSRRQMNLMLMHHQFLNLVLRGLLVVMGVLVGPLVYAIIRILRG